MKTEVIEITEEDFVEHDKEKNLPIEVKKENIFSKMKKFFKTMYEAIKNDIKSMNTKKLPEPEEKVMRTITENNEFRKAIKVYVNESEVRRVVEEKQPIQKQVEQKEP